MINNYLNEGYLEILKIVSILVFIYPYKDQEVCIKW
jgi:hypothetical protein